MKNQLFITKNGKLFSNKGTLAFIDEDGHKYVLPIKNIDTIYCMGNVSLTAGIIKKALRNEIKIHFLSSLGTYIGSLSASAILHGDVIINQVRVFTSNRALNYAKELLKGMKSAFITTFKKFEDADSVNLIRQISLDCYSNEQLLGKESEMWKIGYDFLRNHLKNFNFENREYNPPKGEVNAMISFVNSLIYSLVHSLTQEVGILPEIGFLHSSHQKRFSLVLDVADMFKPIITFYIILKADNDNLINKYDFDQKSDATYLNEGGKLTIIKLFKSIVYHTFYFAPLKRNISLRFLIKNELLKIKNSLIYNIDYVSYKGWERVCDSCL